MNRNKLGFSNGDSDSDLSDEESFSKSTKKTAQKNNHLAQSIKFKTKLSKDKKDEQDESIYEYDEFYDEIKQKRDEKLLKITKGNTAGPKYMNKLIEAKNKRQQDKLILQDLKTQRERLLEGDEFEGKEEFVTSAYKEHKENLKKASNDEVVESVDMKKFHNAVFNDELGKESSQEIQERILNRSNESITNDKINIRQRQRTYVLEQIEQNDEKSEEKEQERVVKSRLLPKLSNEEIEQAKQRYLLRKSVN